MSDSPFFLPETPPLVTVEQARDNARLFMGFAEHLRGQGVVGDANAMERRSTWWLAYAIALSAKGGPTDAG